MSDGGLPEMTVELAEIAGRLTKAPKLDDVVRAYELLYGRLPDASRPAVEVAEEVAAALSLMAPAKEHDEEERTMGQRVVTEATAADGKAMTAGELAAFLARLDPDAKGTTIVPRVRISYRGGIKSIRAEEER